MKTPKSANSSKKNIAMLIVVASLGYFVDIYDLILYNVIKEASLKSLGISLDYENILFRWQMTGMLVGGILWGIFGDKKGRLSVLFGSILLYSTANIANAFATNIESYSFWRFLAGLGLAGELGAAITLVSETMPQKNRGIGTMIIVTFGALGGVFAYLVSKEGHLIEPALELVFRTHLENWQTSFVLGGLLGIILLILRVGTFESHMFHALVKKEDPVKKGDMRLLFKNWVNFKKYLACIMIGVPVWYVVAVLAGLSRRLLPEIGLADGAHIETGEVVMLTYIGLSAGDLMSGLLSQMLKSRKKVIFLYLSFIAAASCFYLFHHNASLAAIRITAVLLGAATGYWALFVTNASEQFGTNIRSTVTATVPNFVRGAVVPITWGFERLYSLNIGNHPYTNAALIMGAICLIVAFWGAAHIEDGFHKNLDYLEE